MKMKKLISGVMAGVMALALAVPAFATAGTVNRPLAESTESTFEVELEGLIYTPTIRVQVTDSGSVYVNPSESVVAGVLTKALDGTTDLDYSFEDLTVVSTPILIRSDTDKALTVSATATAKVPTTSGITLSATKPGSTETAKKVSLYVTGNGSTELGDAAALAGRQDTTDANNPVDLPALDADNAIAGAGAAASNNNTTSVLLAEDATTHVWKATASEASSIAAADQFKTGDKVTSVTPQYGVVMIAGDVAPKCNTWTENDVVNVTVALTFALA